MSGFEVFIGNVALSCKEADMKRLVEVTAGLSPPTSIRLNKRFAFVGFHDKSSAEEAVRKLHGFPFMGDILRVEVGKSAGRNALSKHSPTSRTPFRRSPTGSGPRHFHGSDSHYQTDSPQRPLSVGPEYSRNEPQYPYYGNTPATSATYRDRSPPPHDHRSYSGYPLVSARFEGDEQRYGRQPAGEERDSHGYCSSTRPVRAVHPDLYDPYRRRSPEYTPYSGRPSYLDGAGDSERYPVRELPHAVRNHSQHEDRYGSRVPVEHGYSRSYRGDRD